MKTGSRDVCPFCWLPMQCFHGDLCSNGDECAWIDCWLCSEGVLDRDNGGPVAPHLVFFQAHGVVAYA